ncbi:MAG: sodium ion-translocating decarboxylase subunit beta [Eubacteriales bacterium]|nr:sodium ion-translocating decarboxylase subunit beta [Eubacteriales bacterium]
MTVVAAIGLLYRGICWFWLLSKVFSNVPDGAASVGIIGGADGPTAIFVTASHFRMPWYGFLILALIGVAGLVWNSKKRKEE